MICAKRETAVYDPQAYPHDKSARRSRRLKNILVVTSKVYIFTLKVQHIDLS